MSDQSEQLPPMDIPTVMGSPARYYVDANGVFLGGFSGTEPPEGAIEVDGPPEHGHQTWNGSEWSTPPVQRRMLRKSLVQQRLIDAGKMDEAYALLTTMPSAFARWFAPDRPEVYADDPDALALLTAIGADIETTMAPEEI